jgi:hypothetical protein
MHAKSSDDPLRHSTRLQRTSRLVREPIGLGSVLLSSQPSALSFQLSAADQLGGRPFPVEPIRTPDAVHLATTELLGEPPPLIVLVVELPAES